VTHGPRGHDDVSNSALGAVVLVHLAGKSFAPISWSANRSTAEVAQKYFDAKGGGTALIDAPGGALVANPRGDLERYRDPRGDEPREEVRVAHDVQSNQHRSECRQCRRDFLRLP
jgi:hypothetical protein